jgi:peptidoglycan/LPS O-acetylase OafA/YrhL
VKGRQGVTGSTGAPHPGLEQPPAASPAGAVNNFNTLRLCFALMVVAYHMAVLPGIPAWKPAEAALSLGAEVGVQGFFVLSGYLVFGSLLRSSSIAVYAEKRVRRLYPAYAAVIVACIIAALAFNPETRADPGGVLHYFVANISFLNFLQPNLPGVFETNRFTEVNGALWTLKIEVMFYILLPAIAWLLLRAGRYRWYVVGAIYLAAEIWRIGFEQAGRADPASPFLELSRQLPGQMSFFITGIALALANPSRRYLHRIGLAGAVLLALSFFVSLAEPVRAFGLGAVSVWAAMAAPRLPDAARFGDLSYGLYILHFPIIQTIVALGLYKTPALGIGLTLFAALAGALLLWRYVERPALRTDSAYRAAH